MVKNNRIQLAMWVILLGVNFGFAVNILPVRVAFYFTFINVSFLALIFYSNYLVIFPHYFSPQNNLLFFIISFSFIMFVSYLQYRTELAFISSVAPVGSPRPDPKNLFVFFKDFFWLLLIDLISIIFLMQERIKEQIVHTQKMKEEKLNTELKLLKAQINPHFVFNALNNIYALSYTKSEKAPESILKLAQMLRYVLEECSNERVFLKSEIEYIENFISFQRMKSVKKQEIKFEYDRVNNNDQIAPMLFIPFIENSFKYSKIEDDDNACVNIQLYLKQYGLLFEIRNSVPKGMKIKPGAGMGIENVKQRLNIIYPGNYTLQIKEENHEYYVGLEIKPI